MRHCIVILGPTAAGKSDLAVALAKRFSGPIISADSRQVYRGLDIGTGKITKREMRGVPHYLLNVAAGRSQYSVSRFHRDVMRVIKKTPPDLPLWLVGGSPFYIKTIIEPDTFSAVPPNPTLRHALEKKSLPVLWRQLNRLDPAWAERIDRQNPRRLIRAIEVASAKHRTTTRPGEQLRVLKIGITFPRAELYRRIDRRVDWRLRQGMIAEVTKLHRQGLSWKRLDAFGLEYRYISRHVRGELSKTEMTDALKGAIHDFARRQLTWWRKESDIHWVKNEKQAAAIIARWLSVS